MHAYSNCFHYRMVCALLLLQVISLTTVPALKILMYQEAAGRSHTHFSGALVDVLAEAGHEVVRFFADFAKITLFASCSARFACPHVCPLQNAELI